MKNLIKIILPEWMRTIISGLRSSMPGYYSVKSYAQEGEDLILRRIFSGRKEGFYVDVGAHHPRRFSNTYLFYKEGWHGINIEPNPAAFKLFTVQRKRDINLQIGIAEQSCDLTYYEFDEPALNTFDPVTAESRIRDTPYKLIRQSQVAVERLDHVLHTHLPVGTIIDFFSIDVEGLDFSVLKSNDWQRYRPRCVLLEALNTDIEEAMQGEIVRFMHCWHYRLFAKTFNTLFFINSEYGK